MESRALNGLPQVSLRHIVTSLVMLTIQYVHTHTYTHINTPLDVRELPSSG